MDDTNDFAPRARFKRKDSVVEIDDFPSSTSISATCDDFTSPRIHRRWKSNLCQINFEVSAGYSNLTDHLDGIPVLRLNIAALERKCIKARLYPNPRSFSQCEIMEQYNAIVSELDVSTELSGSYKLVLETYVREVRAIRADTRFSSTQCGCNRCSMRCAERSADTHAEVVLEAQGLLFELDRARGRLRNLARESKDTGFENLTKAVERVLRVEELEESRLVARFFPKQLKAIGYEGDGAIVQTRKSDISKNKTFAFLDSRRLQRSDILQSVAVVLVGSTISAKTKLQLLRWCRSRSVREEELGL